MVKRLVKLIFVLAVIGGAGLAGYAYLGDLSPQQAENSVTVTLDAK